jgi:hypothetical protein
MDDNEEQYKREEWIIMRIPISIDIKKATVELCIRMWNRISMDSRKEKRELCKRMWNRISMAHL